MIRVVKDSLSLPGVLCGVLMLLICISFVSQGLQIRSLLAVNPVPLGPLDLPASADPGQAAAALFGLEGTSTSLPAAQLKLSLLACFVQSEANRSIALIAVEKQPPRRVRVGEEIVPGVRLQAVETRRVLLAQDGQPVMLGLQRASLAVLSPAFTGAPQ